MCPRSTDHSQWQGLEGPQEASPSTYLREERRDHRARDFLLPLQLHQHDDWPATVGRHPGRITAVPAGG